MAIDIDISDAAKQQIAEHLGVHEVIVVRHIDTVTVGVRFGERWLTSIVTYRKLMMTAMRPAATVVGEILIELAQRLRAEVSLTDPEAVIKTTMVLREEPSPPKAPMSRFEAVADELKKL